MEPATIDNLKIVAWVMASFGILKAASTFLTFVAEHTKNSWDNKVAQGLGWFMGLAGKLIDQLIGNTRK